MLNHRLVISGFPKSVSEGLTSQLLTKYGAANQSKTGVVSPSLTEFAAHKIVLPLEDDKKKKKQPMNSEAVTCTMVYAGDAILSEKKNIKLMKASLNSAVIIIVDLSIYNKRVTLNGVKVSALDAALETAKMLVKTVKG
eukprot:jgi/Bigna1/137406/aug1.39_g12114